VQEYRDGIPTTSLCEIHSLGKSTFLKLLAEARVELCRRPMTHEQVAEAQRLYESGLSLSQVSERLGVNQATVQRTLWRRGLHPARA
jgi:transposase-like protein